MSSFSPDSPLVTEVSPSPNHEARIGIASPDILLLHYTGMESTDAALKRLCDLEAKVSSHYLVFEDGRIFQLVPEGRRAYHAGISSWEGTTDINSRSIGIEIGNKGHDFGYPDFPDIQINAVTALCRDIIKRWSITACRVLAHSDVAPARKNDPGEKFPWAKLAQAGIGLWVAPSPVAGGITLTPGERGDAVKDLQLALASFGYGIEVTGLYDTATQTVVTAFQRHFRPERVDGCADPSMVETLRQLNTIKSATV